MKTRLCGLAVAGLALTMMSPANATTMFSFDVFTNAPIPPVLPGDNGPHGPYVGFPFSSDVTVGGSTYSIFGGSSNSAILDATLPIGADIVMAAPQLASSSSIPDVFDFYYSLDVKIYADGDTTDFGDFFVNGHITGTVKQGQALTFNTYLSTVPQSITTVNGSKFNLTRLDFTFPQAPPTGGGTTIGTPGAFSAHITAPAAVPEPGVVSMMAGVGVTGSLFFFRRRRSA